MWSVHITTLTQEEADFLSAEFFELVTAGLEETPTGLRAYFEDSILPNTIRQAFPGRALTIETSFPPVAVEEAADRDPILIGRRFVLVPADRIVLPIDAAMAFGSGRHETTQLCLQALEKYMRPGDTVYDVGCGSGILALAALRLGAGCVIAADTCQLAIAVARRHFPGPLVVGSANCFQAHSADIVLSNITGKVNDQIAAELARITKPTGLVILSGFITETASKNSYPDEILTLADWHCWICRPSHITSPNIISNETQHNSEWWI